jgi:hypothetical protein
MGYTRQVFLGSYCVQLPCIFMCGLSVFFPRMYIAVYHTIVLCCAVLAQLPLTSCCCCAVVSSVFLPSDPNLQ